MASSHLSYGDIDIEEEQKEIDRLVKLLLEYKPKKKNNGEKQNRNNSPGHLLTPKTASSTAKPRGRPPKTKVNTVSRSPSVSDTGSESSDLPSFELLIECIEKLNNQNKILLSKVSELESHVKERDLARPSGDPENFSPAEPSLTSSESSDLNFKSMAEKVNKIENNINSRLLICRGPRVTRKIASHTEGSVIELEKIKAELCIDICGTDIAKISVDSFDVSLFGKNRDSLKIECNNTGVKKYLLNQARQKKPIGIYLVEFLSADKRKIHNSLVSLRKENPAIIKAVYVRGGAVYGKIGEETLKFECLNDVEVTRSTIASSLTTESAVPPLPPPVNEESDGSSRA